MWEKEIILFALVQGTMHYEYYLFPMLCYNKRRKGDSESFKTEYNSDIGSDI